MKSTKDKKLVDQKKLLIFGLVGGAALGLGIRYLIGKSSGIKLGEKAGKSAEWLVQDLWWADLINDVVTNGSAKVTYNNLDGAEPIKMIVKMAENLA